jgi:hypothetical protein
MIEASSFNALGLTIGAEDIDRMRTAFRDTYRELSKKSEKWSDVDFCKTQLTALWDTIWPFLDEATLSVKEVSSPHQVPIIIDRETLRNSLILNEENKEFLEALARNSHATEWLFPMLAKVTTEGGSIVVAFPGDGANRRSHAVIHLGRMRKYFRKYSSGIRSSLRQFVDWVLLNRRTVVTCVLAAGITIITMFAAIWGGQSSLPMVKLILPYIVALVCYFAETVAMCESTDELFKKLANRGLSLRT